MLIPHDDYPVHQTSEPLAHAGMGHPDQYDRFWFNGYTEDFFFAVALGLYPNRGVIDAAFSVVHADVQRSVFASGRIPLNRTDTRVGPIRVEIVEPLRINRIVVDAPDHGLTADLTCHARTPAFEEERSLRNAGTRRSWDMTRGTQMVQWAGRLSSGGRAIDLGGRMVLGTKDRSWGVRPLGVPPLRAPETETPQLFFLWAPLNFEDVALHYTVSEDATGQPWAYTASVVPVIGPTDPVFGPDLGITELTGVRHDIEWEPGLRRARRASIRMPQPHVDVELEPLLMFRMKGVGYGHREWAHGTWKDELVVGGEEASCADLDTGKGDCIHLQQVVRARWGARIGLGVLEQAVFGPYEPAGFPSRGPSTL